MQALPAPADNWHMDENRDPRAPRHDDPSSIPEFDELKSLLLDSVSDGVVAHTFDGELVYFNEAAARQRGFTRDEFARLGKWGWISPELQPEMDARVAAMRRDGVPPPFVTENRGKDGRPIYTEVHTSIIRPGGVELMVSVVRDVTGRVEAERKMEYLAFNDPLTDLTNRIQFERTLEHKVAEGEGHFGVIYIDLDGFKPINDRYGHAVGDSVLQVVAKRIQAGARQCDTVARIGGDEFGVLAVGLPDVETLRLVASRLSASIAEPIAAGAAIRVTASAGCAMWASGQTAADLLQAADLDMYKAKLGDRR